MRSIPLTRPYARRLVSDPSGPRVFVRVSRERGRGQTARARLPSAAQLRNVVLRTLAEAAPQVAGDVTVVVTNDASIRVLNRRFRNKDAPTDVLAFPIGDGLRREEPFGDVVISVDTAKRQAREYGATLMQEMSRLLIHGTLHLCGYDHHERAQAARMHGLTRRLLRKMSDSTAAHA
jgi:probable rRNA maturation factor